MVINYSLPSEVELLSDSSYSVLFRSASVYPLHWSSSFKILLSLFRNFSSGCELTRLCNACEAFFLVSPSLSDWTNCTNNGIQPAKKHYIKYQQILTDTLTLNYKKKKKYLIGAWQDNFQGKYSVPAAFRPCPRVLGRPAWRGGCEQHPSWLLAVGKTIYCPVRDWFQGLCPRERHRNSRQSSLRLSLPKSIHKIHLVHLNISDNFSTMVLDIFV